jgi:hypothetical protein
MKSTNIQTKLLKQIEQKIAPIKLASELMNRLNISKSRAYRLVSNEQSLTIEETATLMAHYPILSFDKHVRPNQAPFVLPVLTNPPKNVFEYLDGIESDLNEATRYPQALISYAAQDLLLFHYFLIPEIALFKLYMWDKTIWNFEATRHAPFDLDAQLQNTKLLQQIKRIADAYALIDSEEIWNINMLDVTLNQIQYCYRAGQFKDDNQVQHLFTLLRQLSQKLEEFATFSHKHATSSAKLSVWYNELIHNNAFLLAEVSESHRLVFSVFDSPNFMHCVDLCIYDRSQIFFDRLKNFANRINGEGTETDRRIFFDRFSQKVDFLEQSFGF